MPSDDIEAGEDAPFPPLPVARVFAYGVSLATLPLLTWWWGSWENRPEALEDRYTLPGWLFLAGLVLAWCASALTAQRHFDHATGAFVLSVGLVAASLLVAFV